MDAKRQQKVLKAMINANPTITVGEAARRLNNIKAIFAGVKHGSR